MKIVISTEGVFAASRLKDRIISTVKGEIKEMRIDTWTYIKANDGYDVLFHNPEQYSDDPSKNVLFRVVLDGENIVFSCAYWAQNPPPVYSMYCLHVGRLTEMLLTYFSKEFSKFTINGF